MLRSVLTELLPNLLKRDVVREERPSGNLTALQSLQRRIRAAEKTKLQVTKPEAPSLRDAKMPKPADLSVQNVHDDPTLNPNTTLKGERQPGSTERPAGRA